MAESKELVVSQFFVGAVVRISLMAGEFAMNQKSTVVLALAAGFIGGILSQYVSPMMTHAQSSAPVKIEAQSFQLVDQSGAPQGGFIAADGRISFFARDHSRPGLVFQGTDLSKALKLSSQAK
jgi:hypothetical protein